jgi:hypothetical protein
MAETTIYLSSTYEDLKDYRKAVFEALRKSGYRVFAMEDYVATDKRPVEKCLGDVEKSDIYVGIFAFRYGYIPPPDHNNPDGLSITELEFRHADDEKIKIPCLTFVLSEDAPWPTKFNDSHTGEGDRGEKIKRLRQYVLTQKTASLLESERIFDAPHQLASLVQSAITKYIEETRVKTEARVKTVSPLELPWDIEKDGSPYPGLMHFTRKFSPVFFGREADVREVLDRMYAPDGRFVIISGKLRDGEILAG